MKRLGREPLHEINALADLVSRVQSYHNRVPTGRDCIDAAKAF